MTATLKTCCEALKNAGLLVASYIPSDLPVAFLSYDSRSMLPGTLFVCKGEHFRREYLDTALDQNAVGYVSERLYREDTTYLLVSDIRAAMAVLAQVFYGNVTERISTVGITGTKGKSTVAFFARAILEAHRPHSSALISSVVTDDGIRCMRSVNTTPDVLDLYAIYDRAHQSKREYMVMEASSQALKYGRTKGIRCKVACFTNFGNDHISPIEHPNCEDYREAKLSLLDSCEIACLNRDMDVYQNALGRARANNCRIITFGYHPESDVQCLRARYIGNGYEFSVKTPIGTLDCFIAMHGEFNVSNALGAIAIACALRIPSGAICEGLSRTTVPGRMNALASRDGRMLSVVDYAHNALSFDAVFSAIRQEFPGRYCVAVFGSPGDKALNRREELGRLAGIRADYVIVTEDDSGSESFSDIATSICAPLSGTTTPFSVIKDREEAVLEAFRVAALHLPAAVLLLGKGDETTQRIGSSLRPYPSDLVLAERCMESYEKSTLVIASNPQ